MSRSTQIVGLKEEAEEFVRGVKSVETDFFYGMFGEDYPLNEYHIDGKVYKEIEQASPWASGPVIFLCLEDDEGNRLFEWTDEEIQEEM